MKITKKIIEYIRTSRLSAWMTATIFFLIGLWYSTKEIPIYPTIITIISLGGLQAAASWINFVCDKDLDKNAGVDIGFFEYISVKEMLITSAIITLISLLILLYQNILMAIFGILLIIVGIIYSAPPLRLKIHPPFDSLANSLEFAVLPLILGFVTNGKIKISNELMILCIISALIVTCYYILVDIFDIETDKSYGIKTTSAILGFKKSIYFGVMILFIALSISLLSFGFFSLISISLIMSTPIVFLIIIWNDRRSIAKILSLITLLWTETSLIYMYYMTKSILVLIISILIVLSALYFVYAYFIFKNKK